MHDPRFSHFVEVVNEVSSETRKELAPSISFLEEIDQLFVEWIPGAGATKPTASAVLVLNAHASFRAAICLAMSGQLLPVFMTIRGAIESVLYANAIVQNPDLEEMWLGRDKNEDARRACRTAFTVKKCFDSLATALGEEFSSVFREAYDSTIDFGAHPNCKMILRSVGVSETEGDRQRLDFTYLHGKDSFELRQSFVACAEVGLMVFLATLTCCEGHKRLRELNDQALDLQSKIPRFIRELGLQA